MLPAVPIDRFTGKPLLYRLTNGVPILYSVGADQIDDGGIKPGDDQTRHRIARCLIDTIPTKPLHADWVLWDPEHDN